jgi:inosine-uridine nucleoside N-ribohydrolase
MLAQMNSRKIIIDTDPGIDDAVAILLALQSPRFDLLGITTVAGNIGIRTTTRNAGRILALADRDDVPVITGAAGPLARPGFDTVDIHGSDGLGGVAFPESRISARDGAAAWIAEQLEAGEAGSIDILALGPLTNIALLVHDHPAAARRIGRIIAMGGAVHEPGNIGARSEFNIFADPEAAETVFRAGLPLTLIPLDVTRRVRASRETTALLAGSPREAAQASGALIDAYFQSTTGSESRPLHDPCVMLYALAPELFRVERLELAVDLGSTREAGALTLIAGGSAVDVATGVDGAAALDLLVRGLLADPAA